MMIFGFLRENLKTQAVAVAFSMAWQAGGVEPAGDVQAAGRLVAFRGELYRCFTGRADELFELADSVLCAEGPVKQRGDGLRRAFSHLLGVPGKLCPARRRATPVASRHPGSTAQYRGLASPVSLADIRMQRDALLALRDGIQARAGDRPIYFPWIPYRDTLRTFQGYLVKMPQEAIDLFPSLRAAVDQAQAGSSSLVSASPVGQAMQGVLDAAGKVARRGRGQGSQPDQAVKVAVEAHAMNVTTEFYGEDWDVEDVYGTKATIWSAAVVVR